MKTACCICGVDQKLESIAIPDSYLNKLHESPEAM